MSGGAEVTARIAALWRRVEACQFQLRLARRDLRRALQAGKPKPKRLPRKQVSRIRKLHRKAWKLFSAWIRSRAADPDGHVACISCGASWPLQQMHAGHYIHGKLDFDPMNVNPQCSRCNTYLYGNLADYHVALVSRYGAEA